jgi:hypothetical protein
MLQTDLLSGAVWTDTIILQYIVTQPYSTSIAYKIEKNLYLGISPVISFYNSTELIISI